jgi:hypothetical protein
MSRGDPLMLITSQCALITSVALEDVPNTVFTSLLKEMNCENPAKADKNKLITRIDFFILVRFYKCSRGCDTGGTI